MESLWIKTSVLPKFEGLERDIRTDVLIIGGGMAGLLCAYMLKRAGIDYALAESTAICDGITKNTTAKISAQHGLIYGKLLKNLGMEKARMYLSSNMEALEKYREICGVIDCDFEDKDSFVYSMDDRKKIENELLALGKLGFGAEFCKELPLPFSIAGAVKFPAQAQFHPLKFIGSIADGLNIFEHTKVIELKGMTAITERGKIEAKKIIITTHFPLLNKHGSYFLKLYQHRSYVIAVKNAVDVQGMYVDESKKGLSFRNWGDLLLIGGGGHRTGKKGGGWGELEKFVSRYYPGAACVDKWAAQDCMSLDGMPYIGLYSSSTDGLYVSSGFNKWGMTGSMTAAMLLCDLIQGKSSRYAELYSPSRSILRLQLAENGLESIVNLCTPTAPRCPHMGCALKWNEQEHSWDCPCHGSRFTEDGKLIDNPATGNLKR